MFTNFISGKGLISRIKNSYNLTIKKINNAIQSRAKNVNGNFSQDIQMANKHRKTCLTSQFPFLS